MKLKQPGQTKGKRKYLIGMTYERHFNPFTDYHLLRQLLNKGVILTTRVDVLSYNAFSK